MAVEEVHDERVTLRVGFEEYERGFPRRLEVEVPATASSATLAYDAVEPNIVLSPGLFGPPGADRILPLEAVGEALH